MLRSSILISRDAPYNTYRHEISLIAGSRPAAAELRRIQLDYRLGIGVHVSSDIPPTQPDLLVDLHRVPRSTRCPMYNMLHSQVKAFANTTQGEFQGFVGYSADHNAVIVALRGTDDIRTGWQHQSNICMLAPYPKCDGCMVNG
jgi:hypothetical protein